MPFRRARLLTAGLFIFALTGLGLLSNAPPALGASIVVNSADDHDDGMCNLSPGDCTLREAILRSNSIGGNNTISFNSSVLSLNVLISLGSPLPSLDASNGVTIDGTGVEPFIGANAHATAGLIVETTPGNEASGITLRRFEVANASREGIYVCAGLVGGDCQNGLQNVTLDHVDAEGNGLTGITIRGHAVEGVDISGGTVNSNGGSGGGQGMWIVSTNLLSDVSINGTVASFNKQNGIQIQGGKISLVDLQAVTANSNGNNGFSGAGVSIDGTLLASITTVTGGELSHNKGDGLDIYADEGDNITVGGVNLVANEEAGIFLGSFGSLSATDIHGVTASNSSGGANIDVRSGTMAGLQIKNNVLSGGAGGGIHVNSTGNASTVSVTGNTVTNAIVTGISVNAVAYLQDATISNNQVSGAEFEGILAKAGQQLSGLIVDTNQVSDNGEWGILVAGKAGSEMNVVSHNTSSLNSGDGIRIEDASVPNGAHNQAKITRNSTFGSGGLGINLVGAGDSLNGVTLNDAGDGDAGPNGLLNYAVISLVASDAIVGTACAGCLVELFVADPDPTGYGEGQSFIADATADGAGNFSVPVCDTGLISGTNVTATATDSLGETSEFSQIAALSGDADACTSTPTPSPSPSATTATHTPAPTPTLAPGQHLQGDLNCDTHVDAIDALFALDFDAGVTQPTGGACPHVGDNDPKWGDADCSNAIDELDALAILAFAAGASPLPQHEPCTNVGAIL